jgi:hypothetical protein
MLSVTGITEEMLLIRIAHESPQYKLSIRLMREGSWESWSGGGGGGGEVVSAITLVSWSFVQPVLKTKRVQVAKNISKSSFVVFMLVSLRNDNVNLSGRKKQIKKMS